MTAPLFPRPDRRRLARDVFREMRGAKGGMTTAQLRDALGLPRRARTVGIVVRVLEEAGILARKYHYLGSVFSILREPTREEMAAPPRPTRAADPCDILAAAIASERGPCSRLAVQVRERGDQRWVAVVHEIRAPEANWRTRKSLSFGTDELHDLIDALSAIADELEGI